jgi:4-amino-4-deoxy-L-arabinose transferase-like glycosyltransferase
MAWALGLYVPLYIELGLLMTESLAVCLICGAFLAAGVALRTGSRMAIVLAGLFLGYLALTKVFFGYVLLGGLVVYGISAAVAQTHPSLRRMAAIYLIGLLATVPYLVYTYQLTGKVFYWSNCGGLSLYWMSTPYDGEWGDWFHPADVQQRSELARHRPLFDSIADLPAIEKDAALRRHAIDNIASHPAKFLRNVAANISRMWYSFPYSYTPQKLTTLFYAVPGSLLLSTLIIAMVVLYARRPVGVSDCHLTIVFMVLTFAGSAVLSACPRMLEPIVPGAFFLIGLAAHTVWNGRDG